MAHDELAGNKHKVGAPVERVVNFVRSDDMRLSEKKRSALYEAINEPVMQKRIAAQKLPISYDDRQLVDELLYKLEREIWAEVRKALNISGS